MPRAGGARDSRPPEARQLEQVDEHVQAEGADPDEEARLVQADERAVSLVEREQRYAGAENEQRRQHEHRRNQHPERNVRRAAQDVFLAALVVAQHAPAGAGELQGDDRDQQHPDEGMDCQERPDLEDRRSLDGE